MSGTWEDLYDAWERAEAKAEQATRVERERCLKAVLAMRLGASGQHNEDEVERAIVRIRSGE